MLSPKRDINPKGAITKEGFLEELTIE